MKRYLFCLFYFAIINTSFAQSFKYRKYHFEWPSEKPAYISVEDQFKNHDAIILEEKCIYDAGGVRIPAYYYFVRRANYFYIDESSNGVTPIVEKYIRIKFHTQDGIKKFSKIILPESFDPTSDWSTVRPENRDSIYRPKGQFDCIRYFAARIIKPDGKIVNAIIDETIQTEIKRVNKIDEKLYNWIFRIINLEPEDELELNYAYEGVFNIDPSSRIFFNGELAKQNYHFTFRYPANSLYILTYNNGAEPNDSVMVTLSKPHYTEYYFSRKNLVGGIGECGARPYKQLPYITFYEHKMDFGLQNPNSKIITKYLPYPWSYVLIPFIGYQYESLNLRLSRKDKSTIALNDFVESERQKVHDTSFVTEVASIQHTLAADFNYQNDLSEYIAGDGELEHLGKYISSKTLREISRIRLYAEILNRFDKDYYCVPLADKRVCEMNMEKYEYQTTLRMAFAIPNKKSFMYLYPKSYRFGYEANEIPFYYEDIRTVLIPQHEASDKKYDLVPNVEFTFLKTPYSGVKDNFRNTNAMVNVSLDSLKISFNVRLKLTGQFSTLIRGYYLYGDRDTTINPNYYQSISELADNGKTNCNMTSFSHQFPYDANFSMNFANHYLLKKESDSNYAIELTDWFNNVIDENFNASNRQLNYYPDFLCQDTYKYMLKFDKKIQLLNADQLQKNLSNDFAIYSVNVTQVDEENILLESNYIVKSEEIPSAKAKNVEEIFNTIKNLNQSVLKIKMK